MLSNRLALSALVVACIAAAAGGGYLATRQSIVPAPAAQTTKAPAPEVVQETEAVIGDTKTAVTAEAPAPAAPPPAETPRAPVVSRPAAAAARPARTADKPASQVARQETPALERSWPSGNAQEPAATPAPSQPAAAPIAEPAAPRVEEPPAPEPARAPEPPARVFEELVVTAESVIGLQTETALTSERARVEDKVEAHVTRAVRVNDRVAIPAGTKVLGSVTLVERGGKFKEQARLGIRFHSLVLDDGTQVPISTETIYRLGDAPNSAQKVGGAAVGGAILGAIIGGGKGAVLGGLAGAGGGAAVTMAGDRHAALLAAGSPLTVRIVSPVTVTVDKES